MSIEQNASDPELAAPRRKRRRGHLVAAAFVFLTGVMVLWKGHINYHGQAFIGGHQATLLGILVIIWSVYIVYVTLTDNQHKSAQDEESTSTLE